MTNCWNISSFAQDLSTFLTLIDRYDLPIEITKLSNLDSQFQYQKDFCICINDVVFKIDKKISGTLPPSIEVVNILFSHNCELDKEKDLATQDPVKNYSFQIQIIGYDTDGKEYVYWWHLDQNIESEAPKFTHPYYHFQSGGDTLELQDTGSLIILGAPRLPHPPMDLFLGIHFIIRNFFSTKDYPELKELFKSYEYQEIIKRAQKRMWEPYFNSFASDNKHLDYTFERVFPLFVR